MKIRTRPDTLDKLLVSKTLEEDTLVDSQAYYTEDNHKAEM